MSSLWAGGGGYIDFTQWNTANSVFVFRYWRVGTTISVTIMSCAMLYIVLEWCLQSHLSTANVVHAASGLQRVRQFQRVTWPLRQTLYRLDDVAHNIKLVCAKLLKGVGVLSQTHELRAIGLRWSKEASRPGSQRQSSNRRSDSVAPIMLFTDVDGSTTAHMPQHAHVHDGRASHESEILQGLLSHERPTFERRSSSVSSTRRSTDTWTSPTTYLP